MENKRNKIARVDHVLTRYHIKDLDICKNCPMKVYACEDDKVIYGTGNLSSNKILVLPYYDPKAKVGYTTLLNILEESFKELFGLDIYQECYVTRLVKCYNVTEYNLEETAIESCYLHLVHELNKLDYHKIGFFGTTFDKLLYLAPNFKFNLKGKQVYRIVSPAVMFYNNEELKNKFKDGLKDFFNDKFAY